MRVNYYFVKSSYQKKRTKKQEATMDPYQVYQKFIEEYQKDLSQTKDEEGQEEKKEKVKPAFAVCDYGGAAGC